LLLTYGGWRLLTRLVPDAGAGVVLTMTAILGWAGMGMAWRMLTDFAGGLAFFGFLYGLLFWRRPLGIASMALLLFAATLIRPSFTFFPLLLPLLVWIVGRVTTCVPWRSAAVLMAACVAGTCVNVAYQYRNYGYWGPSPVVSLGLRNALWHAVERRRFPMLPDYEAELAREIEHRSGRPMAELSPTDEERYVKQVFVEAFRAHPRELIGYFVSGALKYTFVPIEAFVDQCVTAVRGYSFYSRYIRPALFLICLPLWLLALAPPLGASRELRYYWLLVMVTVAYTIGVSAMLSTQGERYRFPMLAFMLPVAARNFLDLRCGVSGLIRRPGGA
jgi:hypothetical protein